MAEYRKQSEGSRQKSLQSDKSIKQTQEHLQKLTNKKLQQLSDLTQSPKRKGHDHIQDLIARTNNKLKHQRVPQDVQFYLKNMKKFENLSSFITSKELLQYNSISMPKINNKSKDESSDEEYVKYRLRREKAQNSSSKASKPAHDYEGFWDQKPEPSFHEGEHGYNVEQQLAKAHMEQQTKEAEIREKFEEKRILERIARLQSQQTDQNNSKHILMKDEEDEDRDEILEIKNQALKYKERSDKVIRMIQQAAKKIYNKKQDQIQKEMIMHQVERKLRQKKRMDMKKQIDRIVNQGKSYYSSQQQRLITNKALNSNTKFFPQMEISSDQEKGASPTKRNFFLSQPALEPKAYISPIQPRKISSLNLKMNEIVDRLDNLDKMTSQHEKTIDVLKILENEQYQYTTLRETLQPDKVSDTLKSLFQPNNMSLKRPMRMRKNHFKNQIL